MGILSKILGAPFEAASKYLTRRMELKAEARAQERQIKAAQVQRQIELIQQGLAADATWELEQIKSSGWKDEYVMIVLSIPLIMCFIPGLAMYVSLGFTALSATPQWYQWLVLMVFAAVYGIRIWRRNQSDT